MFRLFSSVQICECTGKTSRDFVTQKREASLVAYKQAGLFRVSHETRQREREECGKGKCPRPFFSRQRDTLNKQASSACSQAVGKEGRMADKGWITKSSTGSSQLESTNANALTVSWVVTWTTTSTYNLKQRTGDVITKISSMNTSRPLFK